MKTEILFAIGITFVFLGTCITPSVANDNVKESSISISNDSPRFEWTKTYGKMHAFDSVFQTSDHGFIMGGNVNSELGLLYKTDAFGNTEWSNTYGKLEESIKRIESVVQTPDGGYIATGTTDYTWPSYSNVWLIKTDSKGNEIWNKSLCRGRGFSIKNTFDGGYIIGGDDFPYIPSLLVKTDSNGNIQWKETFLGGSGATINDVVQASDGGFIAVGDEDFVFVIKTDVNGSLVWLTDLPNHDVGGRGNSIEILKDGGYIIAGDSWNDTAGRIRGYLTKLDENGTILWDVTATKYSEYNYNIWGVDDTSDGGYILVGKKRDVCVIIKIDSRGNQDWEITFGNPSIYYYDGFFSVQETNDGGYVAVGSLVWNNDLQYRKGIIVKVAPENQIKIVKPKRALYIFNLRILPLFKPLIIGPIDIKADTSDIKFNVERVEFYIDGELRYTDTDEPYSWKWDTGEENNHIIEVVAFSNIGECGGKILMVRKFL